MIRIFQAVVFVLALLVLFAGCVERKPERLARRESPVSTILREMVATQDSIRNSGSEPANLRDIRAAHRQVVYQFLSEALITEAVDLYRAAILLQATGNGLAPETCLLAHNLALQSSKKGFTPARFLAASLQDRYLVSVGSNQRYGTQRFMDASGLLKLFPVDSLTTDSMRAEWDVPSFDSLLLELKSLNRQAVK